jgi:hypothetical protein
MNETKLPEEIRANLVNLNLAINNLVEKYNLVATTTATALGYSGKSWKFTENFASIIEDTPELPEDSPT